jgi:hypothetical protein
MYTPAADIRILSELPLAGQMAVKKLAPSDIRLGLDQRMVEAGVLAPVKGNPAEPAIEAIDQNIKELGICFA